jgi:folate-binding protein YgfZ
VRVTGADAERYLQGQLSQDVSELVPGEWAWSLVLSPQGKLDAFVRLYRVGPEDFLLDTDAGLGDPLVARLLRFRLRTKVEVEHLSWRVVAVRGPLAVAALGAATGSAPSAGPAAPTATGPADPGARQGDTLTIGFEWNGLGGYDLLGPDPSPPEGPVITDPRAYEVVRIEAGFPRHGLELDDRVIPAEAGLIAAAVSFTKGCYTGQELVARIDSRGGNVPRHLRGLLLSGPAEAGASLYRVPGAQAQASSDDGPGPDVAESSGTRPVPSSAPGGPRAALPVEPPADGSKPVGRITSVAFSPRLGWVGLGFVGRSVELDETLAVGGGIAGTREATALVRLLPIDAPEL